MKLRLFDISLFLVLSIAVPLFANLEEEINPNLTRDIGRKKITRLLNRFQGSVEFSIFRKDQESAELDASNPDSK